MPNPLFWRLRAIWVLFVQTVLRAEGSWAEGPGASLGGGAERANDPVSEEQKFSVLHSAHMLCLAHYSRPISCFLSLQHRAEWTHWPRGSTLKEGAGSCISRSYTHTHKGKEKSYTKKLRNRFSANNSISLQITSHRKSSPHAVENHQLANSLNALLINPHSHCSPALSQTSHNQLQSPHPSSPALRMSVLTLLKQEDQEGARWCFTLLSRQQSCTLPHLRHIYHSLQPSKTWSCTFYSSVLWCL